MADHLSSRASRIAGASTPVSTELPPLVAPPAAAVAADPSPAKPRARATAPFAPFEWTLAARYLRPTRKEGIVSIISILSLLGIMIGVTTHNNDKTKKNGNRHELLN